MKRNSTKIVLRQRSKVTWLDVYAIPRLARSPGKGAPASCSKGPSGVSETLRVRVLGAQPLADDVIPPACQARLKLKFQSRRDAPQSTARWMDLVWESPGHDGLSLGGICSISRYVSITCRNGEARRDQRTVGSNCPDPVSTHAHSPMLPPTNPANPPIQSDAQWKLHEYLDSGAQRASSSVSESLLVPSPTHGSQSIQSPRTKFVCATPERECVVAMQASRQV